MDWDDDDNDEFDDFEGFDGYRLFREHEKLETLFAASELCNFAKESIENKHGVKVNHIEYSFGGFKFSVQATDIKDMAIPDNWEPESFGDGSITFNISLERFQQHYHKLEGRDLYDSIRVAMNREFGDVCDIIAVGNVEQTQFGNGVEVVVKMHEGSLLSFKTHPWLPMTWIQDNLVAFEVDEDYLRRLNEASY